MSLKATIAAPDRKDLQFEDVGPTARPKGVTEMAVADADGRYTVKRLARRKTWVVGWRGLRPARQPGAFTSEFMTGGFVSKEAAIAWCQVDWLTHQHQMAEGQS